MKYLLLLALMLGACTSSTRYGECIGVTDDPDPTLVYHVPANNVVVAVIFSETIVVPLVVLFSEVKCPIGKKVKP